MSSFTLSVRTAAVLSAAVVLAFPWLSPLSSGPSASVQPWLVSAACVALLALFAPMRTPRGLVAAFTAVALLAWPHAASTLDAAALAGALGLILLSCGVARAAGEDTMRAVVAAWWLAAVISTAIALAQYFGIADRLGPWVSAGEAGQGYANLRQRNQFASLTAIGAAALLWQVRAGGNVVLFSVLAFFLGVGNASSVSRTGLMELLILAALTAFWPGRSRAQGQVVGCALAGYVLGALALPLLLTAFTGLQGSSLWQRVAGTDNCSSRAVLWSNVAHLISARPWTGWGWGELDFAHYTSLYPGARFCDILDNAHSLPLHVAVELGLPIAALSCVAILWLMVRARPWAEDDSTRQLAWCVLFILGLHSLLEYPLWYGPFQIALGLSVGLLCPSQPTQEETRSAALRLGVVGVFAAGVVYAAIDYRSVSQIYLAPEARLPAYREDPLSRARGSWLFKTQVDFADVTLSEVTRANAQWTFDMATRLLHYSPEPRIIQKIVDSALVLKRDDVLAFHIPRWKAAFPDAYAQWYASRTDKVMPQ